MHHGIDTDRIQVISGNWGKEWHKSRCKRITVAPFIAFVGIRLFFPVHNDGIPTSMGNVLGRFVVNFREKAHPVQR